MSDILVVSDDESDDVNAEINLRVRWGPEYLRLPIKSVNVARHNFCILFAFSFVFVAIDPVW